MWQIRNPDITRSSLDFGLSGRDKFQVFQLFVEDIKLINALELVEWDDEHSQFLICEGCGYAGSRSDNEQVISFYLDAAAFTEWQAMVFDGSEYRLLVESKYVVDPVS